MPELNPVLIKELRGRMRGARAFVLLTMYLLILSGVALLFYAAITSIASSDLNSAREIGKSLFRLIVGVALIEVCLITPVLTAGSISGERERQTYDLLVTSLLSPWQIIWGKLAAALSFAMLLILSIVPLMSLAFLFGGVSLAEVLIVLAGLITTAVFYATIGLFWSAALRSTLGATSLALGSVIMMLLGIPFIALVFTLILGLDLSPDWLNSAAFVYISSAFLYIHPFLALQMTDDLQLNTGRGPFYSSSPIGTALTNSSNIYVPSPWIIYVVLALIFSAILLLLSVRMLRPEQDGANDAAPRPTDEAQSA
jgi:ABC-2 type transport system permease protein